MRVFKTPVLRSDWLAGVTAALMFWHPTSGEAGSQGGRGDTPIKKPQKGLKPGCDWVKGLSDTGGGRGLSARSAVVISV